MTPGLLEEVTDWSAVLSFAGKVPAEDIEAGFLMSPFLKEMPDVENSISQEIGSPSIAKLV